jgi:hypothetical protein
MKNFPRLYSLSALGIRQHQEFDYKLHGFRTDFVGDSGCGKSMIADLIQLVFVTSDAFHSATESMDDRNVDTMVLRSTQGRGSDIGYTWVNVETDADKFLVIGAYLESTSKNTRTFMIQRAYYPEGLSPLDRPLLVADIYVNDQIPTFDMLQQSVEDKGMVFHSFGNRKKFHAYLFKHELLTIDLSQNLQTLRDYAAIIQSFSRGKSLEVGNSTSLKSFLFGDWKAKEITAKYRKAVAELQNTLLQFTQNRADIELVTRKYNALKALRAYLHEFEKSREHYLLLACAYWQQVADESREDLKDSGREYLEGMAAVTAVQQIVRATLDGEEQQRLDLEEAKESSQAQYNDALILYKNLSPFIKLMNTYRCNAAELTAIYKRYQVDKYRSELVNKVERAFRQDNVFELIALYGKQLSLPEILNEVDNNMSELREDLGRKLELLAFADIGNSGTLGNWAVRNDCAYTLELESILMFYKKLPIIDANDSDRYIPIPDGILAPSLIHAADDKGFWYQTGGIRQYVPFVETQLFTTENVGRLTEILESFSQDLKAEIRDLEEKVGTLVNFKARVLKTPEFAAYLEIILSVEELADFRLQSELEIPEAVFTSGADLLARREEIESAYETASEAWTQQQNKYGNFMRLMESIKRADEQIRNKKAGDRNRGTLQKLTTIYPDLPIDDANTSQLESYYRSTFTKAANKENWITKTVSDNLQKIAKNDLTKQLEEFELLQQKRETAFKEARFQLAIEPDISRWAGQLIDYPEQEEKLLYKARGIYETKFNDIVEEHAKVEAYKFEQHRNYLELCTSILPEAFVSETIEEESSISQIEHYLSQINEKNKDLNTRKLQHIREILEEVGEEISQRLDTVRKIHQFLNHEEREITGGHRVSLRPDSVPNFPRTWIEAFIDKLEKENTLFATGETLNELLKDSISLEDKMINAFHTFGGNRGIKPKIEELLNPNSYFNLNFRMESHATGKTNSGSTGQTYAATALLCIARLSLVNRSSFSKKIPRGIRFMPVDEAEGLGSNFDMLYEIAKEFDYQIMTMSINPLGRFKNGEQYIYMLSNNKETDEDVNYPPFGIFSDASEPQTI